MIDSPHDTGAPPDDDRVQQYADECARLAQEEEEFLADTIPAAGPDDETDEISIEHIETCLAKNERGDGLLFRDIHRRRFVYVKKRDKRSWLIYPEGGHHWENDTMNKVIEKVDEVALQYLRAAAAFDEPIASARQLRAKAKRAAEDAASDDVKKVHLAEVDMHQKDIDTLTKKQGKFYARVNKLRSKAGAEKCVWFAHHVANPLAITGDELDQHPMLLACPNCVVDLVSGEPRDGRPQDYLLRSTSVPFPLHLDKVAVRRYIEEGSGDICRFIDDFIGSIMLPITKPRDLGDPTEPDWEIVRYLQAALGYSYTGCSTEHLLHILNGGGSNAKGILTRALQGVGGDYYWTIQSELLLENKNQRNTAGASPDILALRGRRLVVASETDPHRRISAARVKEYTGGDALNARGLFDSDETNFAPSHTLWLQTNNIPVGITKEFSLRRRTVIVDFPWTFVDDPAAMALKHPENAPWYRPIDRTIGEKLAQRHDLLLLWILRGCILWQQAGGLKPPKRMQQHLEELELEEDPLEQFLRGCCLREWSSVIAYSFGASVSRNGEEFESIIPDRGDDGESRPRNLGNDPTSPEGRDAWSYKGPGLKEDELLVFTRFYERYEEWFKETRTDKDRDIPSRKNVTAELRKKGFRIPPAAETGGTVKIFGGLRLLTGVMT